MTKEGSASEIRRPAPVVEPRGESRGPRPEDRREGAPGGVEAWIEGALAYVPSVARRFLGCGLSFDELLAAGNLGLVQAALRFDPSRKVKFVTYADWWIRKAILKTIQEQSGPVRLPRYRMEQLREVHEERTRLRHITGREPDAEELARATGRPAAEVNLLLGIGHRGVSIEQSTVPGEIRPLSGTLADDPHNGPQWKLIQRDYRRHLRRMVARLAERERRVIGLRYGLDDRAPMTLRAVGHELGISRERVRQIERRALNQLRDLLRPRDGR